jgi:hypothetical protein
MSTNPRGIPDAKGDGLWGANMAGGAFSGMKSGGEKEAYFFVTDC